MPTRGDFEEFVDARQASLLRTAYLLTGHAQDAEDLVQMALVRAVPRWGRITGSPEAYVREILVNENISRWRRRRWREVSSERLPEIAVVGPDHTDSFALGTALRQLAPRQRAVIVLRYYEDRTETETAELMGISVGTVKSQSRDAIRKLRTLLPSDPETVAPAESLPGAEPAPS